MLCVVAAVSAWSAAGLAQESAPATDDLARVRAGLARPASRLTLKDPKPDFRIEIHDTERERWMKLFETPLWQLEPQWHPRQSQPPSPFGSQTLASVDLLAIGGAIAHAISDARHARAERDAAEDVRETIDAYCASQPDGGAGVDLCAKRRF